MPSMIVAAGLMALSGMATAFPQGGFMNTTAGAVGGNSTGMTPSNSSGPAPATTGTPSDPVTEALFCPNLSGSIIQSRTGVSEFILACNTNYFGIVIDIQFNSTIFNKRQAAVAPANIQDCLAACDTVTSCVGTAFDSNARTCALYSQIGAAYAADGIDFAIRVATEPATTIPAGGIATSTIYSTNVQTISSCAPTVTNCPLRNAAGGAAIITEVVAVSSTEYVCPAATVMPVAPVACACAYGASSLTVYSVSGTSAVPVATKVVAVPSPSGSTYSTTTVIGSGVPATTAPMTTGASKTGPGMTTFTGAASNNKAAGMGVAGLVAAAALML